MADYPVLIVGAGPTGMALAAELYHYGIDFLIIDKRSNPVTTSNAAAIHARTLECWHHRPWLQTFLQQGLKINGVAIHSKASQLAHFNFNQLQYTQYPYILSIPQNNTEEILDAYLKKVGKPVTRNTSLIDIELESDHVIAYLATEHEKKRITADWLIGCDGYHSTVREKAGIQFIGTDIEERFLLIDAKFTADYAENEYHIYLHANGILAFFNIGTSIRIIAGIGHDPEFKNISEPNDEVIEKIIKQRTSLKFKFGEILWKSHFWIHECVAQKFKTDRIFIAGDAAHVHSPAGGQGMNTGIQDGYNLAWKLAYDIKHRAPSSILDTYELERQPIARYIVATTSAMTKLANIHTNMLLTIRNFFVPLLTKREFFQTFFINRLSQLTLRYKKNSYLQGETISSIAPGQRALDCLINDKNAYLFDLLSDT